MKPNKLQELKLQILYIFTTLLFLTSCQKNSDNFEPYPLNGSTEFLYEELGLKSQSRLINTNEDVSLYFDQAKITIPEGSLESPEEEKIMLHWTETNNALDLFLSKISNSIGESFIMPSFYFDLDLSNESRINEDEPLTVFVEVESLKGLDLFEFNKETNNWEVSPSSFEIQESVDESGNTIYGASLLINHKGKYCLGTRVNFGSGESRDVCVSLPGEYNSSNSIAFVKLEDNLIIPLSRTQELGTFCRINQLPVVGDMTLVVLTNIRIGQYEIFIEDLLEDNENVNLEALLLIENLDIIKDILKNI